MGQTVGLPVMPVPDKQTSGEGGGVRSPDNGMFVFARTLSKVSARNLPVAVAV